MSNINDFEVNTNSTHNIPINNSNDNDKLINMTLERQNHVNESFKKDIYKQAQNISEINKLNPRAIRISECLSNYFGNLLLFLFVDIINRNYI
jgi:hypothetical protein